MLSGSQHIYRASKMMGQEYNKSMCTSNTYDKLLLLCTDEEQPVNEGRSHQHHHFFTRANWLSNLFNIIMYYPKKFIASLYASVVRWLVS